MSPRVVTGLDVTLALRASGGCVREAARALGTDRGTLRRAARRAGVAWPELPAGGWRR